MKLAPEEVVQKANPVFLDDRLRAKFIKRLDKYTHHEPNSGCTLWAGALNPAGYGVMFWAGSCRLVHRLAYAASVSQVPNGTLVLHRCDTRCCVNPQHLFLGSNLDNVRDMNAKGRRAPTDTRGHRNGRSKLSVEDVIEIKRRLRHKPHQGKLAREFGISETVIAAIKNGRRWRHVDASDE